jgi:hypothetical protein
MLTSRNGRRLLSWVTVPIFHWLPEAGSRRISVTWTGLAGEVAISGGSDELRVGCSGGLIATGGGTTLPTMEIGRSEVAELGLTGFLEIWIGLCCFPVGLVDMLF